MGFQSWRRLLHIFNKPLNENSLRRHYFAHLPKHIAIIMDGNGRWAKKRGLPRSAGHRAGVESLRDIVKACSEMGISYLTVYAFSTENWKRPKEEVDILMDLLAEYLQKELINLHKKNIKINPIGELEDLPSKVKQKLEEAVNVTKQNTGLTLTIALNYGGRNEIINAVKLIGDQLLSGKLVLDDINDETFRTYLYTNSLPDPDLLIRPSGELRVSNFLLWQIAYTEFWITDIFWPDFRREHLYQAINDYNKRERRFGGLKK
ncbi:isoprenyl transferase [Bacillota bacterium LX-D]|nr:isoprenyl transferase [Bacillota bacterium LX-D]